MKALYLVNVLADPRPRLVAYRYAMPGEDSVAQQELHAYKRGEQAAHACAHRPVEGSAAFDIHWPVNSDKLRLVRRDRLQRNLELIEVDLATQVDQDAARASRPRTPSSNARTCAT